MKQKIPNLYIFHAVLPDGYTHTVDVYAMDRGQAVLKLELDHGVRFPNFRLVRIIYSGRDGGGINFI